MCINLFISCLLSRFTYFTYTYFIVIACFFLFFFRKWYSYNKNKANIYECDTHLFVDSEIGKKIWFSPTIYIYTQTQMFISCMCMYVCRVCFSWWCWWWPKMIQKTLDSSFGSGFGLDPIFFLYRRMWFTLANRSLLFVIQSVILHYSVSSSPLCNNNNTMNVFHVFLFSLYLSYTHTHTQTVSWLLRFFLSFIFILFILYILEFSIMYYRNNQKAKRNEFKFQPNSFCNDCRHYPQPSSSSAFYNDINIVHSLA